jgi:hypothetical protein
MVTNFVSAGGATNCARFLFRIEMPCVSSLSRSGRLPSGRVLLLGLEAHRATLIAVQRVWFTR